MQKLFLLLAALPGMAFAQSRQLTLCDNQNPRNCYNWDIGANLATTPPVYGGATITGPILPLNGGTMVGRLRISGGFSTGATVSTGSNLDADTDPTYLQSPTNCAATMSPAWSATVTYALGDVARVPPDPNAWTSLVAGNTNNPPASSPTFWIHNCIDDRTKFDWFGMEGNFIRITGKSTDTIGDYFDWTRFAQSGGAIPIHQVNFNDSAFNNLIHIDEHSDYHFTTFDHSGIIRFGLNTAPGVNVGITQNATVPCLAAMSCPILEVNNGVQMNQPGGAAAQVRALGYLANQDNDNSGYIIQSNGGIEMTAMDAVHNILSKSTSSGAFNAPNGGVLALASNYNVNNAPVAPAVMTPHDHSAASLAVCTTQPNVGGN